MEIGFSRGAIGFSPRATQFDAAAIEFVRPAIRFGGVAEGFDVAAIGCNAMTTQFNRGEIHIHERRQENDYESKTECCTAQLPACA